MGIFKNRPLSLGCFVGVACLVASYFLGNIFSIISIILGAALLFAFILLATIRKSDRAGRWLTVLLPLCICLIACGISALFSFGKDKSILNEYSGTKSEQVLLIKEITFSKSYGSMSIAEVEGEDFDVLLVCSDNGIKTGDRVSAELMFQALSSSEIGYSESEYYLDKGIFLRAECETYEIISSDGLPVTRFFTNANSAFASIAENTLNHDTASLVSAMLLGNKGTLDADVRRDFSRLGISHILALSGIHIALISALFGAALSVTFLRKQIKYVLLMLLIVGFIALTGFSLSALRAGIMLIIFYTLDLFGRKSDGVTSLFLSVLLICIADPYAVFSTSLLLSFCAMLGCIASSYFTRGVKALYRIRPKFIRSTVYTLISSVGVTLFTLPIMSIKFGYVSLFAPIFNALLVPMLTLLLYLSPFVLILGNIPYVCYAVKYPAEFITKIVLTVTENVSRADFLTVSFTNAFQMLGVLVIFASIVLALARNKKKLRYSIVIMSVGVCVFALSSIATLIHREATVSISTYEYRSCDIVAVESNNEVMIFEISSPSVGTSSFSNAVAADLGYSDIDTYVLCDYGAHILNAFDSVSDRAVIRKLMLPEPKSEEEAEMYECIREIADSKGIKLSFISEKFDFGEVCVDFMGYELLPRSSKRCVAFSLSAKNSRFTYLGASSYECINYFPKSYAEASDIILFGSYGPSYYIDYSYGLTDADYFVFHGVSRDYCGFAVDENKIKESSYKFILTN